MSLEKGSSPCLTGERAAHRCSLCAEAGGRSERNLFHALLGHRIGTSYLLFETENFVVMPSVGSLVPGYLLVVPRRHALSFGHVSGQYDEELRRLTVSVESALARKYGKRIIFFEHGPVSSRAGGGSCVDHAHLHAVPVPDHVNLVSVIRRDFAVHEADGFGATREWVQRGVPYLLVRHHDARVYICDAWAVVSQYLRRALALQLGRSEEWDWAAFSHAEHVAATIDAFADDHTQAVSVVKQEAASGLRPTSR